MIALQSNSRSERRSERLEELLNFAAAYRGWTARQLAAALERDPSNLVPDSGVPKLDLILRLAETLDWQVADLVELLGRELGLGVESIEACSRHRHAIELLQHALIEPPATDGRDEIPDACRRASLLLRLAQAHCHAGDLVEGRAVAGEALASIAWLATPDAASVRARALVLRAACVRELVESMRQRGGRQATPPDHHAENIGAPAEQNPHPHAHQRNGSGRQGVTAPPDSPDAPNPPSPFDIAHRTEPGHAGAAGAIDLAGMSSAVRSSLEDLSDAERQLDHPAVAERLSSPAALRHRANAVRRELEETLDPRRGREVLRALLADLDAVIDVDSIADLELLESHGWSCVGGLSLAERHLAGTSRQQALAILSNKADEIASKVGSWALRERVLTFEHMRRRRRAADSGADAIADEWLLDRDDLRAVIGCIGNSRRFRRIGLDILRHATIVDCEPLELARRPRSPRSAPQRLPARTSRRGARPAPDAGAAPPATAAFPAPPGPTVEPSREVNAHAGPETKPDCGVR